MEWREKWPLVRPFLIILLLHALAVLLFTRGFLLTRTELSVYSHCDDVRHSPCSSPRSSISNSSDPDPPELQGCWTRPAIDRVVIIVLDALRFDFVAPSTFFDEPKPWMDKLTVLQRLAADSESSARIFKAFADPPTTTLQRLKGLTTGGLPTFIDVGNSFGAPAIIEDNLIYQLARNGKRVLMMGDDTWMQLFPDHFDKSYPYPSFNVKDLDTVDDGCIEHLLPSLHKDDWDVLIAHFLGVDHAGHIFGVESTPMIQKLEQYNSILEKVVEVLKKHSEPDGLHERTLLVVMGDHGQTINGDHGGGTPEEVETSLFAMSLMSHPDSIASIFSTDSCRLNLDGANLCIGSIQQTDFAVTIAALLGIPFPFGSIGRVNPELYALNARTWQGTPETNELTSDLEVWMKNYMDALCRNCWQVKRYIDLYSATSVIGFSSEDLQVLERMYTNAQANLSNSIKGILFKNDSSDESLSAIQKQIDAYSNFLASVAALAHSKWTEFDLKMMSIGLGVLFISLFIQFSAITRLYKSQQCWSSLTLVALFLVAIRASSFLSNSYILAEGKVANFLLASATIASIRYSMFKWKVLVEEAVFLVLIILFRFRYDSGLLKQIVGSTAGDSFTLKSFSSSRVSLSALMAAIIESLPFALLLLLAFLLYWGAYSMGCWRKNKIVVVGTIISYLLMATLWALELNLVAIPFTTQNIGKTFIPRAIYSIGFGQMVSAIVQNFRQNDSPLDHRKIITSTVAMLFSWSSTILMLLGKQGPFVVLVSLFGAWCIVKFQKVSQEYRMHDVVERLSVEPMSVVQWSLLAVCLFFYTGHWCAFDGLRYGAAFIGFDDFNLVRQGVLLAIDTFGVSHILPILGLPLLVILPSELSDSKEAPTILYTKLNQGFLIYGLVSAVTTTFTIICVTIQRRHLMVWGLFAPKFVFDVVGLILTDVLIFWASLFYF